MYYCCIFLTAKGELSQLVTVVALKIAWGALGGGGGIIPPGLTAPPALRAFQVWGEIEFKGIFGQRFVRLLLLLLLTYAKAN